MPQIYYFFSLISKDMIAKRNRTPVFDLLFVVI